MNENPFLLPKHTLTPVQNFLLIFSLEKFKLNLIDKLNFLKKLNLLEIKYKISLEFIRHVILVRCK